MFAGRYDHALDEKGRTMMPKRFRDRLVALGDKSVWVTLAIDGTQHLDVLPDSAFNAYFERMSKLPDDKTVLAYRRAYFGSAVEVEVDSVGRILVPAALRARCGLGDKIAFVGVDPSKFELWSPAAYDAQFADVVENSDAILAHLAHLEHAATLGGQR